MEPKKKIRHTSNLKKKIRAVEKVEKGFSMASVAIECDVSLESIRRWRANKEMIKREYEDSIARGEDFLRCKKRKVRNEALETDLYEWFKKQCKRGMLMNGPRLAAKALELNKKTGGHPEFSASQGWLYKWKRRHGIRDFNADRVNTYKRLRPVKREAQKSQVKKITHTSIHNLYLFLKQNSNFYT